MIGALGSLTLGLVLLIASAEALIRGATRLGRAAGMPPLVVGLTIVAVGTSSPEAAVSVYGALVGASGVAVGNVVGSNIFNVLLILGVASMLTPIVVPRQLLRLDLPFLVASAGLAALMASNGVLAPGEAGALLLGGVVYLVLLHRLASRASTARHPPASLPDGPSTPSGDPTGSGPPGGTTSLLSGPPLAPTGVAPGSAVRRVLLRSSVWIVGGVGGLVVGSRFLVSGATEVGTAMGVSDLVMGVTVVAAGTSLPELATSLLAGFKNEYEVAVGNIIGSNIFNVLFVLGLSGIVAPGGLPIPEAALSFDIPVMVAASVACVPLFFTGRVIARWEGALLALYYVSYVVYLVLDVRDHAALPWLTRVMGLLVIPVTLVVLSALAIRELWHRRSSKDRARAVG